MQIAPGVCRVSANPVTISGCGAPGRGVRAVGVLSVFITDGPARRAGAQLGGLHSMSAYSAGAFPVTITGNLHKLSHPAPPSARRMPQAGPRGRCAGVSAHAPPQTAHGGHAARAGGHAWANRHKLAHPRPGRCTCSQVPSGRGWARPLSLINSEITVRADAVHIRGGTGAARRRSGFFRYSVGVLRGAPPWARRSGHERNTKRATLCVVVYGVGSTKTAKLPHPGRASDQARRWPALRSVRACPRTCPTAGAGRAVDCGEFIASIEFHHAA